MDTAIVKVSNVCNYSCSFCFAEPVRPHGPVSAPGMDGLLDRLRDIGVSRVVLSGGEPTLVRGLEDVVIAHRRRGLWVGVLTNGSNPRAALLSAVDLVQVSIDGPSDIHDVMRGQRGAFRRAVRCAQEHGSRLSVQVTVTRKNAGVLRETISLIKDLDPVAVRVVAADGLEPDSARTVWPSVYRSVAAEVGLTPTTVSWTSNIIPRAVWKAAVCSPLESLALPLFVDATLGTVAVGVPDVVVGRIDDDDLGGQVRAAQYRASEIGSASTEPVAISGYLDVSLLLRRFLAAAVKPPSNDGWK